MQDCAKRLATFNATEQVTWQCGMSVLLNRLPAIEAQELLSVRIFC